jgi:hypothetical protein
MGISTEYYSQTGGKKHERRGKRRGNFILTQYKSHGHADKFARGSSGRKGRFARLFKKKKKSSWVYRSSGSRRSAFRANQYLLTRTRSKGKIENAQVLDQQNSSRSKSRVYGNKSFKSKRYKSR